MNRKPKIAVIGGTGKAGQYLVRELLRQDFPLKLLLRNPENFQVENPLIEVVPGDARDYEAVRTLTESCEAVISAVGFRAGEEPIFSLATENVLRAMQGMELHALPIPDGPKCKYALRPKDRADSGRNRVHEGAFPQNDRRQAGRVPKTG